MTEATAHLEINQAGFDAFLQSRNEPGWSIDLRRAAWKTYSEMEWPRRNQEEWMRTDIRLFKVDKYGLPADAASAADAPEARLSEGVELAGSTVSLDSRTVDVKFDQRWADKGVLFGSLSQLISEHGDLIKPHLFSAFNSQLDRFAALHAACWSGGTLLYVPRGVVVDQPFLALSALQDCGSDFGHTLVILEPGAEATLLSETASCGAEDDGFHCGAIELLLGDQSNLRYVNLQDWGQGVWHFAQQKAVVGRDASLQWTIGALGARLAKVNQHVSLVGEGANAQVNGVMFTEGKQHLSYHTLQHHEAPNCRSDLLYKAALQDRSRTVWRGMIKVDPAAQKTDGYQRNDNLLLSAKARADSIPGLEIEADDVRCTHGSTSGRVDEELIFYCLTRGFTRKEAIRAIVAGFFQQISDRITIQSVRDTLAHAIARRVRDYE